MYVYIPSDVHTKDEMGYNKLELCTLYMNPQVGYILSKPEQGKVTKEKNK